MPIRNPPDLYTGGAVVFNSQPYVNFYERIWARKQAKEAALEEYNRDLMKRINSEGMRTIDIPILVENEKNRRDYFQQNRDAIFNPKRDGGRAQSEYQGMIQESFSTIQTSKNKGEIDKQWAAITSDPTKKDLIDQPEFDEKALHDLPFNDEKHKEFKIGEISFHPKDMDTKEWTDYYKDRVGQGVTQDKNIITIEPHPTDRFSKIETTISQFSQPKLMSISDMAKFDYDSNRRLRYSFNKNHELLKYKEENAPEFEHLRDIYKLVYGKDAEIEDERDLHAAIAVQSKMQPTVVAKRFDDVYGRQEKMAYLNHSLRLGEKEFEHALDRVDKVTANLWFDEAIDNWTNTARKNQDGTVKAASVIETQNGWKQGHKIPVTTYLAKTMMKDGKSPDDIFVTTDNEYIPVFYKRDGNGLKIINPESKLPEVNKTLTVPESREMFKLDIGGQAGMKQKNIEMSGNKVLKETTTKSAKTYKYKGKTFTPEQIKKQADRDGVTVEQYLKATGIEAQ